MGNFLVETISHFILLRVDSIVFSKQFLTLFTILNYNMSVILVFKTSMVRGNREPNHH